MDSAANVPSQAKPSWLSAAHIAGVPALGPGTQRGGGQRVGVAELLLQRRAAPLLLPQRHRDLLHQSEVSIVVQ